MSKVEPFTAPDEAAGADFAHRREFQQVVLERTHDLITVLDPLGTIRYGSPSWRTLLGWEPGSIRGMSIVELVHPDDEGSFAAAIGAVTAGNTLDSTTVRLRKSDGRWVFVDANATPLVADDGRVRHVLTTARDVTEREELRGRVRELDALYRIADGIGRSTSLDELLEDAVDTLIAATGADRASVLLYDDDDVMRFRAWRGLSDEYRAYTEGHSPWKPDASDPQPVLVGDVADGGFDPGLERTVRKEGIASLAFIPLVHSGRLVGKFMLYRDTPHEWDAREVRLCRTIANHLASATVRTRARVAWRESREQLETIMRTVDEGIVVLSADAKLVYANEAAVRLIGFGSVDALDTDAPGGVLSRFEVFDEDGNRVLPEELPGRRALRGESSERTVRYRVAGVGQERWSIVRANPVYADDGSIALAVSVIHDVTDAKNAERRMRFLGRASEALNESLAYERTLGTLAELAVPAFAGHVTVDLYEEGLLRCVAARHVDPEKTKLMISLREKYPPTVPDHPVQRALRNGAAVSVPDVQAEAESMAHDATHAQAIRELGNESGIAVPLIARGRTFGALTFGSVPPQPPFTEADIELAVELGRRASIALDNALLYGEATDRAHAAEALEFVDDGVFLLDRDEIVRLWNPAAAETFRVDRRKAIGRPIGEVVTGWETVRGRITAAPAPTAGVRRPEMVPVDVQGDERWLSISAVRFVGGTVYAFRDMTEERAVEQLKSDFVSTISHELRTPLAAVYGAAVTLQRSDVRFEESQRAGLLEVIALESDRLARIVNDILWASRLDSGLMGIEIASCDAARIVRQVVDAVRAHAPADVRLTAEATEDLPRVAADPDKLRGVLTNLLDNAVKYSPGGGTVRVSVAHAGNRIRFRVADDGLGIPAAEQSRIFEKFYRLDPNLTRGVGGTGLGLYICRELVHRMHGRIWVASDGRRGSKFTVELPVAR